MSTLFLILVPAALFVVAAGVFLALLQKPPSAGAGARGEAGPVRPRWGNPRLWLLVCAVFVVLGLVVAPRLFGVAFLFLPFIWIGGARRRGEPR